MYRPSFSQKYRQVLWQLFCRCTINVKRFVQSLFSCFYSPHVCVQFLQFRFSIFQQNLCSSSPCLNNGTCQVGFTSKGFRCVCEPGYAGANCNGIVKLYYDPILLAQILHELMLI